MILCIRCYRRLPRYGDDCPHCRDEDLVKLARFTARENLRRFLRLPS